MGRIQLHSIEADHISNFFQNKEGGFMKRNFNIEEEILINQFSQGLVTIEEMNKWFATYDLLNKKDIIHNLLNLVIQSHPTYDEIESSAILLNKITSSSAVKLLNRNKPFNRFGYEICDLPEKELQTGFDILLFTLAKADKRRKEQEDSNSCTHWWHKDLSDEEYLQKLRNNGLSK